MHYILLLTTVSLVTSGPINILSDTENHMDEVAYVPYDVEYVPVNVATSIDNISTKEKILPEVGDIEAETTHKPIILDDVEEHINEDTSLPPISILEHPTEHVKDAADLIMESKHDNKESSFDLFQEKFNHDAAKTSDDTVLVPISVRTKLQDASKKLLQKSTLNYSPEHEKDAVDFIIESKAKSTEDKECSFDLFHEKFNHDPSKASDDVVMRPISVVRKLQDDFKMSDSSGKTHIVAKRQAPDNDFLVYRPVVQFRRVFRDRIRIYRPPAFVGYLNDYDHFPTVA